MERSEKKMVAVFADNGDGTQAKELCEFLNAVGIHAIYGIEEIKSGDKYYPQRNIYIEDRDIVLSIVFGSVYVAKKDLDQIYETSTGMAPSIINDNIKSFDEGERDIYPVEEQPGNI